MTLSLDEFFITLIVGFKKCIVNTPEKISMLKFDLKGVVQEYEAKTGLRLTYVDIAQITGVATDTIKSLASRDDYNTSLAVITQLCSALNISPLKFLSWHSEKPRDGY
jgi:hypothetical protein